MIEKNKPDFETICISVVMTVYNCERYIEESIRSILAQTMADFEFIIVDDGSTDCTKELIVKYNDPRIKFYPLEHVGRACALNYAVEKAQGTYVIFMDADDIALPERIEKQYLRLQQNPEIGVVSGWYQLIDAQDKKLYTLRKLPERHTDIEYEMTKQCSMCFPATMMRSHFISQVGGFNEQLKSAIDYDLFVRILPVCGFSNMQELMLYHKFTPIELHQDKIVNNLQIPIL